MLTLLVTTIPDPDPLPLPAAPWLLWSLLMLTFVVHVVAMNVVLGGSVITAAARIFSGHEGQRLAKSFGKAMPTVVATAITFGVAPLLFLQALYGRLFFTSAVLLARYWLAVVPLVILAYYGTYLLSFRGERLSKRSAAIVASGVALLFLAVAFIYTNNMSLMLRPDRFLALYRQDGRGVQLNVSDPTFVPRYLHMVLSAIAVAALAVALYGVAKRRTSAEHGTWAMRYGALWFTVPTLLNLITGVWWLGSLPKEVVYRFMGQNLSATLSLGAGIAFGFASVAIMFMASATAEPARMVRAASVTTLLTLMAMIVARDQLRRGMLELGRFSVSSWVEPQWGVIALFGVLLVAAVGTTIWMLTLLKPRRAA